VNRTEGRQHEISLLVEALRSSSGDPELDDLARAAILANAQSDDVLKDAALAVIGPEQAELDLHFDGHLVEEHMARAEPFGLFIARTADAVKEISKAALGRKRYRADLLVSAVTPGSLRVLLRSPIRRDKTQSTVENSAVENVESAALRTIAILLSQAGEEPELETGSPVAATIEQLPPPAREQVRSALKQVVKSGWSVEGELRQRGVGLVKISLGNEQAARLHDELSESETSVERAIEIVGTIDGTRRFTGTMWFQPEGAERPFVASVTDAKLLERVNAINATPETRVKATFERYGVFRPGAGRANSSKTHLLTDIVLLPSVSPPVPLDGA
jgi:hypothetical protein